MILSPVRTANAHFTSGTSKSLTFSEVTALDSSYLLVATLYIASSSTPSTPSGWTSIGTYASGPQRVAIYARQGDSSSNGISVTTANAVGSLTLAAWKGYSSLTPLDVVRSWAFTGESSGCEGCWSADACYGITIHVIGASASLSDAVVPVGSTVGTPVSGQRALTVTNGIFGTASGSTGIDFGVNQTNINLVAWLPLALPDVGGRPVIVGVEQGGIDEPNTAPQEFAITLPAGAADYRLIMSTPSNDLVIPEGWQAVNVWAGDNPPAPSYEDLFDGLIYAILAPSVDIPPVSGFETVGGTDRPLAWLCIGFDRPLAVCLTGSHLASTSPGVTVLADALALRIAQDLNDSDIAYSYPTTAVNDRVQQRSVAASLDWIAGAAIASENVSAGTLASATWTIPNEWQPLSSTMLAYGAAATSEPRWFLKGGDPLTPYLKTSEGLVSLE